MKIIQDKKHKNMFRIQWPDKTVSTDFYNQTRAKEHLQRADIENLVVGRTYNSPMARREAH